ncbi:MAG TPA: hypothetical protein VFZ17_08195 [Acidimicrobiia bacterium]|nr:hypothetical protein [Acidimicrobiia bacterium]
MSSVPPGGWDPNDSDPVPVGPEPEPTGAGGAGSGGWGEAPRTEPFAIAALVWALVSIVLPIVGTIVALVLAARAADSIRRSRGTRSGTGLVTAARVIAGVVIALWAIGAIVYVATRDDGSDSSNVAVPTQPSNTTTSLLPSTTTTTKPPVTTTAPPVTTTQPGVPTTSIAPPPPTQPTTPPTQPTEAPTQPTEAPTTQPTEKPTTTPPPVTTSPEQATEARIQQQLLKTTGNPSTRIGPSNRDVPDDERVVVTYVPGQPLVIQWAINNGAEPLPTGEPNCPATPPPTTTSPPTTTTAPDPDETTTTAPTSTTGVPGPPTTAQLARTEARKILNSLKNDINQHKIDIAGVQLIGTYPVVADNSDVAVVQVFYTNADVLGTWPAQQAFKVPPAADLQCLNPAFA